MARREKQSKPEGLYTQATEAVEEKKKETRPSFVTFTKKFSKMFASYGKGAKFNEKEAEAFAFLGYDITPEEFYGVYNGILRNGLIIGLVLFGAIFFATRFPETIKIGVGGMFVLLPVLVAFMYKQMPYSTVEKEKINSLAHVPEIVNYLTMSMRLTPNLEKAVQFAANHGQGKIAEDLKKIVWDTQIGRYESVEEGLDELAYRWGAYNEDFKHALMLIRASVLEADKERRFAMLEKASQDVLEGTREKMDLYARKLQQPTVYLYYFGILLPLLMAILLPIGSSLANNADIAKAEFMFIAYNFLIPIMVFVYGKSIIGNKPPTTTPPKIGKDFPGLPPSGTVSVFGANMPFRLFAVLLIVGLVFIGYQTDLGYTQDVFNKFAYVPAMTFIHSFQPYPAKVDPFPISGTLGAIPFEIVTQDEREDKLIRQISVLSGPEGKVKRDEALATEVNKLPHLRMAAQQGFYVGQFTIFGLLLGLAISVSVYLLGEYGPRKEKQDEIRAMEAEFKDAMYVLASRMGENKPIEEALRSAVAFLPKSIIGRNVFRRILENITTMGMTLDAALFDKTFGALHNVPSHVIRSGMQFLSDSVELGVDVASKSLIALSMQLRNSEKINESLKKLLEDVTVMLKTMSTFVAPIVLGVVSAMQRLIISSIASQGGSEAAASAAGGGTVAGLGAGSLGNMFNSKALASSAEPGAFVLILGLYVIEIVMLLTYFNSQIEDTNNELHTYVSIAKTLPMAVALFCLTVFFTGSFFTGG
ncbi:hypothetical protein HZC09_03725 [Candidatus Micrarchaeota archaeon]|nr:hypothetical protein [Candidatus Micrarchaeota archaeon]